MAFLKYITWDVCLGTAQNEFHVPYDFKVLDLLLIEAYFLCAIYILSLGEQKKPSFIFKIIPFLFLQNFHIFHFDFFISCRHVRNISK